MLQHVAVCCSVLQRVAAFRESEKQQTVTERVLKRDAVFGSVLQCVAVCCSAGKGETRYRERENLGERNFA